MYQLALSIGALIATIVAYFLARYLPDHHQLALDVCFRGCARSGFCGPPDVCAAKPEVAGRKEPLPGGPGRPSREPIWRKPAEPARRNSCLSNCRKPDPSANCSNPASAGPWASVWSWPCSTTGPAGAALATTCQPCSSGPGTPGRPTPSVRMRLFMMGAVLFTFAASRLVDRTGRRPLWLAASASMCFALILAGLIFQLNISGPAVILVLFLCMAPHAVGLGPLPWLMMSEIFPTRIRARAVAVATTFLWVAGFSGPFCFPILESFSEKTIGSNAGVFWLYAAICIFAFFWGLRFLPETRGRSLGGDCRFVAPD